MSERFGKSTAHNALKKRLKPIYVAQRQALENDSILRPFVETLQMPDWVQTETDSTQAASPAQPKRLSPLERDGVKLSAIDMPTVLCKASQLLSLLRTLKDDARFRYDFLIDLTSVDFLGLPHDQKNNLDKRFQLIYLLRSRSVEFLGATLRVKVPVGENESAPSITPLWDGANWPEREVFDLMGIHFEGHPDLRRILLPDAFRGHPLRKDFPVKGMGEDYLIEDLLKQRIEID